jgi:hypothetical protein
MAQKGISPVRAAVTWLRRFFRRNPDSPGNPQAGVGAPRRPRTPQRSASAVAELPEE